MSLGQRWLKHGFVLCCVVAVAAVASRTTPLTPATPVSVGLSTTASDPGVTGTVVARTRRPPAPALTMVSLPLPKPTMTWPVTGLLTQSFGPSPYWFEPAAQAGDRRIAHFHTGMDLAAVSGTPVTAAAEGRVITAGWRAGGYGNVIVLRHTGGVLTLYAHLSHVSVRVGEPVAQGALIGAVGSTGNSTGAHLHFEVRPSERTVEDPMRVLDPAHASAYGGPVMWTGPGVTS